MLRYRPQHAHEARRWERKPARDGRHATGHCHHLTWPRLASPRLTLPSPPNFCSLTFPIPRQIHLTRFPCVAGHTVWGYTLQHSTSSLRGASLLLGFGIGCMISHCPRSRVTLASLPSAHHLTDIPFDLTSTSSNCLLPSETPCFITRSPQDQQGILFHPLAIITSASAAGTTVIHIYKASKIPVSE
jgi:hypothetical protein